VSPPEQLRDKCIDMLRAVDGFVLKSDTVAVLTVLPRYWGRNTRDSRGDEDQSCGTTAAMGLSFSHVHEN